MTEVKKIRVYKKGNPKLIKEVTPAAFELLGERWVKAEDQSGVQEAEKKIVQAVPVVEDAEKRVKLANEYKELTGLDAESAWNIGKLHVEIHKAKALKKVEVPKQEPTAITPAPTFETPTLTEPVVTEPVKPKKEPKPKKVKAETPA